MKVRRKHNFLKLVSFVLGYFFAGATSILAGYGIDEGSPAYREALQATLVELAVVLILVLMYAFVIRRLFAAAAEYRTSCSNKKLLLGIFLIYPLIVFLYTNLLLSGSADIYRPIEVTDRAEVMHDLMLLPMTAIIGPIFEEFCCRVMCISVFESKFGKTLALIVTTILFALCHGSAFAAKIPTGLLYGIVLIASKNIVIPIVLHMAWNLSAFIVPTLTYIIMLFGPKDMTGIFGSPMIAVIIHVIAFMVGVILIIKNFRKDGSAEH